MCLCCLFAWVIVVFPFTHCRSLRLPTQFVMSQLDYIMRPARHGDFCNSYSFSVCLSRALLYRCWCTHKHTTHTIPAESKMEKDMSIRRARTAAPHHFISTTLAKLPFPFPSTIVGKNSKTYYETKKKKKKREINKFLWKPLPLPLHNGKY